MTPAPKPLTWRDVARDCKAAAREAWEDVRDGLREKGLRRMLRAAWRSVK